MLNESDIVLDEYEQSVENTLETFTPVSPETRRRLDAILAREEPTAEPKRGKVAYIPLAAAPA